jgi:hypothetical protein
MLGTRANKFFSALVTLFLYHKIIIQLNNEGSTLSPVHNTNEPPKTMQKSGTRWELLDFFDCNDFVWWGWDSATDWCRRCDSYRCGRRDLTQTNLQKRAARGQRPTAGGRRSPQGRWQLRKLTNLNLRTKWKIMGDQLLKKSHYIKG